MQQSVEEAGYRKIAANLALQILARKDLIEIVEEENGYDRFTGAKLTPEGWQWLHDNAHFLNMQLEPVRIQQSNGTPAFQDIPF